ncbi:substrate-binding periplasmic protein [Pseudomonas anguilliseptica]|uniref:Amino acid ABC transporter substrate-binding protein, PAAT family n=1 Tax=Pseudomonas anguilliseptica TaxID=53406 RepID=A0A1H4TYI3_PSEAG|nr:transporter substrate-binding domain-containing protein [Pseudomonas anguilliseptica]SEC61340.1 amino acid ABC transporter substrate-binding protein, PAAT family [Pseudomonas anguilliseptica]
MQTLEHLRRLSRHGLAALLLGLLFSPLSQAALPPGYKMVLLTENFPPFNMAVNGKNFARDANIQGISADIVREMFKRAGIDYSLTLRFPWDRIYQQTMAKTNHGLFSTSMSEARKPLFKWVGPIAEYQSVLVGRKGSHPQLSTLEQAKAYRVGAYQSAAVSQHLERLGFTPQNALRDQENIRKLQRGQIDLWATSDPVWRVYAKEQGVDDLQTVLSFETSQLYLALNKDTPDEVVERLQAALEQMRSEGYGSCAKNPELC